MIPHFPDFAPLEIAHRSEIDQFVRAFPPYSDFNFLSLISWDVRRTTAVSFLHNHLVVKMSDYLTGECFFTFLGIDDPVPVAARLLDFGKASEGQRVLRLVPDVVVAAMRDARDSTIIATPEDADHDYILSVGALTTLSEPHYRKKRAAIAQFATRYGACAIKRMDTEAADSRTAIGQLFKAWQAVKQRSDAQVHAEWSALQRCLAFAPSFDVTIVGAFVDGDLRGWTVNEVVHHGHYMGHFGKAHPRYVGLMDVLEHETAKIMALQGCTHCNYQQDLGLPGLRAAKRAWHPVHVLRKFRVEMRA